MDEIRIKSPLKSIFGATFFFALHAYFVLYINSSFLNLYVSEQMIGLIYSAGALLAILAFMVIPKILRVVGNYTLLVMITVFEGIILTGLAFATDVRMVITLFLGYLIFHTIILFNLDIFLEKYSPEEDTGKIRGEFLTTINVALLMSPLIVGLILTNSDYWKIYIISSLLLIPALFIVVSRLRNFKDPHYDKFKLIETVKCVLVDKYLSSIFIAGLVLRIFFAWMVIYTPLYLHNYIGLSWSDIGIVFTIMLIPYVILELPLGKIADDVLGEKKLLVAGFLILSFFTALIALTDTKSVIIWAALLFATRVGASFIDIMTETNFFRQVDGTDTNTISLFRMVRPLSNLIAPALAAATLFFMPLQYSFFVLALIVLIGIPFALKIRGNN